MSGSPLPPVAIWITGVLLGLTASLSLAARALGRLQRRAWAAGDQSDPEQEDAASAVEAAFIALGAARQLLLVALTVQVVAWSAPTPWGASLYTSAAMAIGAWICFDKLLPYALVLLVGPPRVLRLGDPWFRFVRLALGPLSRALARATDFARDRHLQNGESVPGGDLGAFLDLAEEEGLVSESEEALLRGVADFEETVVREVMTPRVEVVAIDADATLGELRHLIARHRLSRIPVVRGDLDHVVGVVNIKDLVAALESDGEDAPVTQIARPVWFVPESKRVSQLLPEFQRRQEQIAIVVDEYGGTAGLVTLEDVVEEIVGEIQDEDEAPAIEKYGDSVLVNGKAEIEAVEEALGVRLPEGDFHTIGGLVFTRLGRVPEAGETLHHGPLQIEVLEADDRRIHKLRIRAGD